MKRNHIALLLALALLVWSIPALAKSDTPLISPAPTQNTLYIQTGTIRTLTFDTTFTGAVPVAVALFDKDNLLTACTIQTAQAENGKATVAETNIPYPSTSDGTLKVFFYQTPNASPVVFTFSDGTPAPTLSPTPTLTPTASPTASPKPTTTPRPSIHPAYEKELDAAQAFAIVEKVTIKDVDGDSKVLATVLWQGKEQEILFDSDITIQSAPDAASHLVGAPVTSLKKGDVVYFWEQLNGKFSDLRVIYRPETRDIITSDEDFGTSFETLYTEKGLVAGTDAWSAVAYGAQPSTRTAYAFGVIEDKNKNLLTLFNKDGRLADAIELELSDDTIVYTCNMEEKALLEIKTVSSLRASSISRQNKDDEDNVIRWDKNATYYYALARIVNGTVTDIVMYRY